MTIKYTAKPIRNDETLIIFAQIMAYMESLGKKYEVFISYSHEDVSIVLPIIKLVRSIRDDLVFHDVQDIRAGKPWEPQIVNALNQAEIVIVFWCSHSSKSDYVRKEYLKAIENNKDVLPIILDKTELSLELSKYQAIDFGNIFMHNIKPPKVISYTIQGSYGLLTLINYNSRKIADAIIDKLK